MHIARVETRRCAGGEGPLWDPIDHVLYFIDNSGQKVHRYDRRLAASWDMVEQLPESFRDESSKATPREGESMVVRG